MALTLKIEILLFFVEIILVFWFILSSYRLNHYKQCRIIINTSIQICSTNPSNGHRLIQLCIIVICLHHPLSHLIAAQVIAKYCTPPPTGLNKMSEMLNKRGVRSTQVTIGSSSANYELAKLGLVDWMSPQNKLVIETN